MSLLKPRTNNEAQLVNPPVLRDSDLRFLHACGSISDEPFEKERSNRSNSIASNRLSIKSDGKIILLNLTEIDAITADGNYVHIHTASKNYIVRETLHSIGNRLPKHKYIRIHRSTIINADNITEMHPWPGGEYQVWLKGGKKFVMSKTFRSSFEAQYNFF
ncbi:MAG: LytTR family transcriptional regulator [Balneolales bacterium]|nr:LytTR family transcriptional regulator [Balneolales bacterium]